MGLAVVTVAAGGLPVVETPSGMPVTEAANARGIPVTKVVGKGGMPVVFVTEAGAVVPSGDPSYANVAFLWEAEGTNGQTAGLVDGKNARPITLSGTAKLSSAQARIGATSLFVGTGGASTPSNADYRLGNVANTSPFSIEFSAFEGTLQTWEAMQVWGGTQKSWWVRIQSDGNIRFLASADGTSTFSLDVTTTGFGFTAGIWHDIMIEKDVTGKLRFFRNGLMKYSITPANSVFFPSTNSPLEFPTQASSDGYVDHIRLTKSTARVGNDAGYTFIASPFPTS